MSIVLGIDPGTTTIGYAILDTNNGRLPTVCAYGTITTLPHTPMPERLTEISHDLRGIIETYHPDIAGIERLYFTRNVTNGLDVAMVRGLIVYLLTECGITIHEYTPPEVKKAISGNGRAPKRQVQNALQMILHLDVLPTPDDAADALAIAYIAGLDRRTGKSI